MLTKNGWVAVYLAVEGLLLTKKEVTKKNVLELAKQYGRDIATEEEIMGAANVLDYKEIRECAND